MYISQMIVIVEGEGGIKPDPLPRNKVNKASDIDPR